MSKAIVHLNVGKANRLDDEAHYLDLTFTIGDNNLVIWLLL